MSDTYSYEVLEPGGHARLVGNVLDRISRASANPASAVGSSRAMLGDTETASWMERTTAADGAALIEAVYGNTLRWNQLADGTAFAGHDSYGITAAYANGKYTIDGTTTRYVEIQFVQSFAMASGHKYLFLTNHDKGNTYGDDFLVYDKKNSQRVTGLASLWSSLIFTADKTYEDCEFDFIHGTAGYEIHDAFTLSIFDLTAMFGAGNEPATVAEFEALYPKPYYPYNPGSLLPVRMEGVETVAADESWSSQRTIPAATYFPDGLRSAGSVRDELTATQAITRVGERAYQSGDESDASVITDGTVTQYALATPTTTPIDPPLPMSYRVGAGGTERVMVASGTTSAPPIFATRYPLDPADLAASIAPVDGPIAKTNHQVGDLLMLGFTLCKATQVIVTGETIEIGTNVTRTSVAAELAALSE